MGGVDRSSLIAEVAHGLGFDLVGLAPLAPPPAAERFRGWLAAGHHAGMDWLVRQEERICDPRLVLPEGTAMVVVGLGHARAAGELEGGGRVARYALGRDYHNVIGKRLAKLARVLEEQVGVRRSRKVVDAGPLLERSHAAVAGLGFESKASNLLHHRFGPWFFLGELLVEMPGEPPAAAARAPGSCGTCRACLDACPTQAIRAPGVVDANRCISYHTIENRGASPVALRAHFGLWAFGCDVCSEVCPFGRRSPDRSAAFGSHAGLAGPAERAGASVAQGAALAEWLGFDERRNGDAVRARFEGSPLRRPGPDGLARNAAVALGNAPSDLGRDALMAAVREHSAAFVREAAAWALAQAHGHEPTVRAALDSALSKEIDTTARVHIAEHRAGLA
jgi:epoxyqueuosine reductase